MPFFSLDPKTQHAVLPSGYLIPSGRPAAPHPGTRRAQGQAPRAPANGVLPKTGFYPITRAPHRPPPARRSMKTLLRTAPAPRPRSHPRTHASAQALAQNRARPASAAIRLGHIHQFVSPRQSTPPQNSARKHRPREPGLLRMPIPDNRDQRSEVRCHRSHCRLISDLLSVVWSSVVWSSGGERDRTDDLLLAKQALSQLSYTPAPEVRSQRPEIRLLSDL